MSLRRRALLAATGIGLASRAWAQGAAPKPLRIGVLTDMSGPFSANTGAASVAAARFAIEDFGGSVLGRKIELISADHQNKPDIAAATAREWFDREGVSVAVDLVNSSVALAVMDVARDRGKLSFVAGSGSTAITNENCTRNNVQWVYDSYATANTVARSLIAEGKSSWFFVTADYAFGLSTEQDARRIVQAAGGRVLGSVRHPPNATDFASYLVEAQASGAQVIALASAGAASVNAAKQAAEFGLTGKVALVSLGLVINDVQAIGLDAAQGMYLSEGFYWDQSPATRAFAARFMAAVSKPPNMVQAGLYSGITHYLKAVAAAGDDKADEVMARMRATPVEDAVTHGGIVRADGLMVHDMLLLQVKTPAQSRSTWDLFNVVKTVPGDQAFLSAADSRCKTFSAK